jgi:hypothetical protein
MECLGNTKISACCDDGCVEGVVVKGTGAMYV